MTTETLIQKVREKVGAFDEYGEKLVVAAMEILQSADQKTAPQAFAESFISRNISMEEYIALPTPERSRYQSDAEKSNRHWIEKQFNNLHANWIMVVDGQVVKHGATLDDYPEDEEIYALQEKTGKCPFVFFSSFLLAIEESATTWHKTNKPGDAYPALLITISGNNKQLKTEADLDSGAVGCYCALDLLQAQGIIKLLPKDIQQISQHLSQPFIYFTKQVWLELVDKNEASRRLRTSLICVTNWQNSPFTTINPNRTFLIGRSVLLNLRPRLVLDFDACCTEVQFGEAVS